MTHILLCIFTILLCICCYADSRDKNSPRLLGDDKTPRYDSGGESAAPDSPRSKTSVVLMPLRRNTAAVDRDFIPSPRRPRTATEEDVSRPRSDSLDLLSGDKDVSKTWTEDDGHAARTCRPTATSARRNESTVACQVPSQVGDRRQAHIHRPLVRKSSSWTEQMTDFKVREGSANLDSTEPHHVSPSSDRKGTLPSDAYSSPSHSIRKSALHMAGTSSLRTYGASSPHSPHHGHNGGQSGHGHSNHHSPSTPDRAGTAAHSSRLSGRLSGSVSPYQGFDSAKKSLNKTVARKSPLTSVTKGSDI